MPVMDPSFYKKLLEVSNEVQMKPEDLLNVMAVESGIDPTAHNQNGNASGLIQFMPSTLKSMGFKGTHTDFRGLSATEQLDWVKKYITDNMKYNGGPFTSAAQYYVANFLPIALKLHGIKNGDPNTIIVSKNPKQSHLPGVSPKLESIYYNANTGLDADKDGNITFGDIQSTLNRVAGGKNFREALAQLQNTTGYKPRANNQSMMAHNTSKPSDDVLSLLDKYLQQITASDSSNKGLYQKLLPNNDILIKITANTNTDAIEFSRILTSALDEELLSRSFIHTNGDLVEVQCKIHGPSEECLGAVSKVASSLASAFEVATKKIGGIRVMTDCIMNKKSSYNEIDLNTANYQYRKFMLKFV
jgi:hypothetical protein